MKKKKQEKKVEKKQVSSEDKRYERQLRIIVIVMLVLIAGMIILSYLINKDLDFEYEGINFKKVVKEGDKYYSASIITHLPNGATAPNHIAFRNHPKDLEDIPINTNITLFGNWPVYVSLSKEILESNCSEDVGGLINMGLFWARIGIKSSSATTDINKANESGIPHITCENLPSRTTGVIVKQGNSTQINHEKENCYVITVKDCDLLNALERFMIGVITHSSGNYIN